MRILTPLLLVFSVVSLAVLTACGGGGGGGTPPAPSVPTVGAGGSGVPETQLQASLSPAGLSNPWPGAVISGNAIFGQFNCNPQVDASCLYEFVNEKAGSTGSASGRLNLNTDAIPGEWQFGANADSYCSTGASTGLVNVTTQPVPIVCGNTGNGSAVPSPGSCIDTIDPNSGNTVTTTCPSTITLTVSGTAPLPLSPAVKVSYYTDAASLVGSSSITAASTTKITIPTPTTYGVSVVTMVNPNTNQVVGAGLFTRSSKSIKQPPPCNPVTHYCTDLVNLSNRY